MASFNLTPLILKSIDPANRLARMDESKMKYAVVQRRWTDELTRSETTSRGSGLVQDGKSIKYVEEERSKQLFECPSQDDERSVAPSRTFANI